MNKYQKAWGNVENMTGFGVRCKQDEKDIETIRELVNKETPMKPLNQEVIDWGLGNAGDCKNCSREVNYQNKYCDNCGQQIDWSDNK